MKEDLRQPKMMKMSLPVTRDNNPVGISHFYFSHFPGELGLNLTIVGIYHTEVLLLKGSIHSVMAASTSLCRLFIPTQRTAL